MAERRIYFGLAAVMKAIGFTGLLALAVFLAGCSSTADPVATATQPAAAEPATPQPEPTMADPAATAAQPAVAEPATPQPEPTTAVAAATAETNLAAGIEELLRLAFQPAIIARYASPDASVEAQVVSYACTTIVPDQQNALDILRIVNLETEEIIQEVDSQLISCGGLGAYGLGGLYWSPSGRYFYYTGEREGVPDGCGYWSPPISRYDSADGTTRDLGQGALSSDGRRLAVWQGGELVIWEIDGDEVGRVPAADPSQAIGPTVWSPDDQYLVYLQADQFCEPNQTTVVRVDVAGMSGEVLLTAETPAFIDVAWFGVDQLVLADAAGGRQYFVLATGELRDLP